MVSWWGRRLGVQIGKQKPVIIHTEFFLFFNTGSCFTNGAVIHMDWRQIVSNQWAFRGCWGKSLETKSNLTPNLHNFVTSFPGKKRVNFTNEFVAIYQEIWSNLITKLVAIYQEIWNHLIRLWIRRSRFTKKCGAIWSPNS